LGTPCAFAYVLVGGEIDSGDPESYLSAAGLAALAAAMGFIVFTVLLTRLRLMSWRELPYRPPAVAFALGSMAAALAVAGEVIGGAGASLAVLLVASLICPLVFKRIVF
jgi:hypothetical protein